MRCNSRFPISVVLAMALMVTIPFPAFSAGFTPGTNPNVCIDARFSQEIVASGLISLPPVDGIRVGLCDFFASIGVFNTGVHKWDLCAWRASGAKFARTPLGSSICLGPGSEKIHGMIMTNAGRIIVTNKNMDSIREFHPGSCTMGPLIPNYVFGSAREPDGIAYNPTDDTIYFVLNNPPQLYRIDAPGGVSDVLPSPPVLLGAVPNGGFIDHIGMSVSFSRNLYLSGHGTGTFLRYDIQTGQFCTLSTSSPGVDGVTTYKLPSAPSIGLPEKGVLFNHNNGTVILFPDEAPGLTCPTPTPLPICTGGTRGDGVLGPADGCMYAMQLDGITCLGINVPGPVAGPDKLFQEAGFVEPGSSLEANLVTILVTADEQGTIRSPGLRHSLFVRTTHLLEALKAGDADKAIRIANTELFPSIVTGLQKHQFTNPSVADNLITILNAMSEALSN